MSVRRSYKPTRIPTHTRLPARDVRPPRNQTYVHLPVRHLQPSQRRTPNLRCRPLNLGITARERVAEDGPCLFGGDEDVAEEGGEGRQEGCECGRRQRTGEEMGEAAEDLPVAGSESRPEIVRELLK